MTVREEIQHAAGDPPPWVWKALLPLTTGLCLTTLASGVGVAWSLNEAVARHEERLGQVELRQSEAREDAASDALRLRGLEGQISTILERTKNTDDRVREILQIAREAQRDGRFPPNP